VAWWPCVTTLHVFLSLASARLRGCEGGAFGIELAKSKLADVAGHTVGF